MNKYKITVKDIYGTSSHIIVAADEVAAFGKLIDKIGGCVKGSIDYHVESLGPVGDVDVHKYEVLVLRKSYMTEYIEVEATSEEEAEKLALKEAEKVEFLGDEYFDEYAVYTVVRADA